MANPPPAPSPAPAGRSSEAGRKLVARRHPEWREHQLRWRWLLDSLEGGERYRQAIYGTDRRGVPVRNLVRHKREYPDPREAGQATAAGYGLGNPVGSDPAFDATDDDYELRRARTPVPTFVAEAISDHLDRVYAREVRREGPAALGSWWADADGTGAPIDCWLKDTVAPVLLACGSLDVLMDHPPAPEGEAVATRADVARLGLSACIATPILPENMVWWRLDRKGRYAECLVREYPDGGDTPPSDPTGLGVANFPAASPLAPSGAMAPSDPIARYRHWTATESVLYDADGRELARMPHPFGRVPIVRLMVRKKPRCRNVGQPTYEGVAERQREFYNRDSELILSDTTQAHPLLQGPEDFVQADGTVPIGPSWLLPKKKNNNGGSATYEGFGVVDFPKGGAESLRQNKADLRDEVDRDAALQKPAGASANGASVVSQSGYSKAFDNARLNNKLGGIADALAAAEKQLAELALTVLADGPPTPADLDAVKVEYSRQFDLSTVEDLGSFVGAILKVVADPAAAQVPTVTAEFLKAMVRQALPGRDDDAYAEYDEEILDALATAVEGAAQALEGGGQDDGPAGTTGTPTDG